MKALVLIFMSFLPVIVTGQAQGTRSDGNGGFIVHDSFIVTLRSGVTMDQYLDFLNTRYVPEYDRIFQGSKLLVVSPETWKKKNQFASFYFFDTEKEYHKYYPDGKEMSAECKSAWEKLNPLKQEESKFLSDKKPIETEWEQWMDEVKIK
jgi:hypothetical protein